MEEIPKYHQLAKDAGNKLRAYILSISSGATGILFLFLVKSENNLNILDKCLLSVSLLCFVSTVCICLYELNIDARRFFLLAKELKKPEKEQSWETNKKFKKKRFTF